MITVLFPLLSIIIIIIANGLTWINEWRHVMLSIAGYVEHRGSGNGLISITMIWIIYYGLHSHRILTQLSTYGLKSWDDRQIVASAAKQRQLNCNTMQSVRLLPSLLTHESLSLFLIFVWSFTSVIKTANEYKVFWKKYVLPRPSPRLYWGELQLFLWPTPDKDIS